MSPLVLLPKRAIRIWQGWTRRLWVSISAGSYQSTGPSAVFFTKMRWSLSFLKITSYRMCCLMSQSDCYSCLGHISEVRMKKGTRGLQVKSCMFTSRCYSFCSWNYSSLARERGFALNMRLRNLTFNVWGCFSFGNSHYELQILSPKAVLKGKEHQVRNQNPNLPRHSGKQEAGTITCVCFSLWEDEKEPLSFDFSASILLLYTSFIDYSCTIHIHD